MRSKVRNLSLVAGLVVALAGSAFAGKQSAAKQYFATGTITSVDASHVVVNEKVKGKEQSMTYKLDSSTQKSGKLANGTPVSIQYHKDNNESIATSVRERNSTSAAAAPKSNETKAKKE